MRRARGANLTFLSPGVCALALLALLSGAVILTQARPKPARHVFWLTARAHHLVYGPVVAEWNATRPDQSVSMLLLDGPAMERRMLSGLLADTPIADVLEMERPIAARAFTGPLEDVGFVDLTDRLAAEGLLASINRTSFSPWTSRGRIFGIPHDVHPVLLAYRADIIEAAGIDMSEIETWADFARVLRPLMADSDGDRQPDRFLINFWPSNPYLPEALLLQAGGQFFDEQNQPVLDSDTNVGVLAELATWITGPNRIAIDAPEFSTAGNRLRLNGKVVATIMPDWIAGAWKIDLPGLRGKIKLMPLPAWQKGGRRTTVTGGTMLGIPKSTTDFEAAWQFAKHLYFSPELAERFYRASNIITPVKDLWTLPVFDEPDPFFSGQPAGRLFINQAEHVPARSSSPYNHLAASELGNALFLLKEYADSRGAFAAQDLRLEARRLLKEAQSRLKSQISRNAFLRQQP